MLYRALGHEGVNRYMAIKQFHFSFKLDAKDLLEYVTERNVAVEIQAYGSPPKKHKEQKQLVAPPQMLALPPPTPREPGKRKVGAMDSILIFCAMHSDEFVTTDGIKTLLVQQGYSGKSINSALWNLKNNGLIRGVKGTRGRYRVTPKGIRTAEEIAHG